MVVMDKKDYVKSTNLLEHKRHIQTNSSGPYKQTQPKYINLLRKIKRKSGMMITSTVECI